MSDISFQFTLLDFVLMAPLVGWPGLALGALAGAFLWRKRRILGAALGGVLGCAGWFAVFILTR